MPTCLVTETSEFSQYSLDLPALWQETTGGGQLGQQSLRVLLLAMPCENGLNLYLPS